MNRNSYKSITRAQRTKFFSMCRAAARNLGLSTTQEIEDYRRRVMLEEAFCDSVKHLGRKGDFDSCIRRFAADAGDSAAAVGIGIQDTARKAYVVKVMSIQIMQLKGGTEADARTYLDGIINQARVPCGVCTDDNSFWMDVSPHSLQNLVQILDTYRRKLLKANFPAFPMKFDDTVRYEVDGYIRTRYTDIPRTYYSELPFKVNVRG